MLQLDSPISTHEMFQFIYDVNHCLSVATGIPIILITSIGMAKHAANMAFRDSTINMYVNIQHITWRDCCIKIDIPFWINLDPWWILTTVSTITHTGQFDILVLVPRSTSNIQGRTPAIIEVYWVSFLNPSFDIGGKLKPVRVITAYSYMVLVKIQIFAGECLNKLYITCVVQ